MKSPPSTRYTMTALLDVIEGLKVGSVYTDQVNGTTADLVVTGIDGQEVKVRMPTEKARHVALVINAHI